MAEPKDSFKDYLRRISRALERGDATEGTHRPALKQLLESIGKGITATNEPKRIRCGAPDFNITRGTIPLGHVETKDIGVDLDEMEKGKGPHGEQFTRYRDGLANWILTDYLEFRWYVTAEKRLTARLAGLDKKRRLKPTSRGNEDLAKILSAFLNQEAPTVGTARELAQRMAGLARIIHDLIIKTFEKETEKGWLHSWLAAFRKVLIPDLLAFLSERGRAGKTLPTSFADMFAQTLAYGLFAARFYTPAGEGFSRKSSVWVIPKANPFLRKFFSEIVGLDMPDTIAWAVDEIVEILKRADMDNILKDFGKARGREDPIVHFYETFLSAYDPTLREIRGVYYTPEPVVSYIVRSIDQLLRTHFNRPRGLADQNTLILDPAVGTATFLYFVIDQIQQSFAKQKPTWDDYVSKYLLNRIFGFEILMAPYAIAHLKLGIQLQRTGYTFASDQRLGIYLTNTLEEAGKKAGDVFAKWLSDEANAASNIKTELPIMVVLGNPPYSGISANRGEWITKLIEEYRKVDGEPLGEKKVWLKNDYVKFIRFGQWRIERTGYGILAFITDHSYLDSPTFRGMRQNLLKSFNEIYILNLHGNTKRREKAPDGNKDENVFDITQGVAIALFVKHPKKTPSLTQYSDLWGLRESKYQRLENADVYTTDWQRLTPSPPYYLFVPVSDAAESEYNEGWKVTDIFRVGSNGVQTSRDDLVVAFERNELISRFERVRDKYLDDATIRAEIPVQDSSFWNLGDARRALQEEKDWDKYVQQYLYRPFDQIWLFASPSFVHRLRLDVMKHLQEPNLALCVGRAGLVATGTWNLVFCANRMCDHNIFYRGSSLNFPLYLYGELFKRHEGRTANLSDKFIDEFSKRLEMKFILAGRGDLKKSWGPQDLFDYVYAVLHSPTYRTRYAEFLKHDFPRVPLTRDSRLFAVLSAKGGELTLLHLLESPKLNNFITEYPQEGTNIVEKVEYGESYQRVHINEKQYFAGVPKAVWEFEIGGYQICKKWLRDRKGHKLTFDDIQNYQKSVVALNETIRLMGEIDKVILHWPVH